MALSATIVLRGFLGTTPKNFDAKGVTGTSFRLACTHGYYDRQAQEWKEMPTTWVTVRAYRSLASNILHSLTKGDPIVVAGDVVTNEWEKDGVKHSDIVVQASAVGHDLNQGTTDFHRSSSPSRQTAPDAATEQPSENQAAASGTAEPAATAQSATDRPVTDQSTSEVDPAYAGFAEEPVMA